MLEIQYERSTARWHSCVWKCPRMDSKGLLSGRPLRRCIHECPIKYCSSYQGLKLLAARLRYNTSGRPLDSISVRLCVQKCPQMDSKSLQSGQPLQRYLCVYPTMYCSSYQGLTLVAARLRCDVSGQPLDSASVSGNAPK